MILPLIGLTASQFIASATIVSFMLNINYPVAVIIVAIVVTAYSIMGGLWSVTITDFVQVFLIIIGMALALPFSLNLAGGMQAVAANVPPDTFNPFKGIGIGAIISMIVMYIAFGAYQYEKNRRRYHTEPRTEICAAAFGDGNNACIDCRSSLFRYYFCNDVKRRL